MENQAKKGPRFAFALLIKKRSPHRSTVNYQVYIYTEVVYLGELWPGERGATPTLALAMVCNACLTSATPTLREQLFSTPITHGTYKKTAQFKTYRLHENTRKTRQFQDTEQLNTYNRTHGTSCASELM